MVSTSMGEQVVHFMLFCPTERASELEQLIREDFMSLYHARFTVSSTPIQTAPVV